MRARLTLPVMLAAGALILAAIPAVVLAADPPQPAFGGPLAGSQEVPAVTTTATGEGTAVISPDGSKIWYFVTYSGLSGPAVAAHIHTGASGQAGGVILPLKVTDSPMVGTLTSADFKASGPITSFADAVAAIKGGQTYFNIHTAANGGGEIRGQIGVTVPGSLPATSTETAQAASGGSALPALIGLLVFVAFMVLGARRLAPRSVR